MTYFKTNIPFNFMLFILFIEELRKIKGKKKRNTKASGKNNFG